MTVLVCTDLDRTLIYSRRAAGAADLRDARCVEVYDGAEASFVTRRASEDLCALDGVALWVPITTRTVAQYSRIDLPRGSGPDVGSYTCCANGGVILHNGRRDLDWAARIRNLIAEVAPPAEVEDQVREMAAELPAGAVGEPRDAEGLFRYYIVNRRDVAAAWVDGLAAWCLTRGWRTSLQGRKLYCLPAGITKSAAAAEIARRVGATTMIAAGDSMLDADLLTGADLGVRPAHGELEEAGWRADHVTVTSRTGISAGEDIARWLLRAAASDRAAGPSSATPSGRAFGRRLTPRSLGSPGR